jgi:AcrR family transcriptional regulator
MNELASSELEEKTAAKERQGPRWKRRKEARPKEVIDAALALFAERGYAQTRLDDVAMRAGISKGTVYLYFASKQELFEAVIQDRVTPWLDALGSQTIDPHASTEELLRSFLQWGWNQFLESKLYMIARVVLAESSNFPHLAQAYLREVMGPIHDHVLMLLERGQQRNEVLGEVNRERAKLLISPLSWLAIWRQALIAHGDPPLRESVFVQQAIEMAISSICTRKS